MADIHDNGIVILKLDNLTRIGVFDEDAYIVYPSLRDRITLYKYMRALMHMDSVREKLEPFTRMEFNKQNYIVSTIGVFLLDKIAEALEIHDKETVKKYMDLVKKETARINEVSKAKNGYISDMTRSSAEAILASYMGEEAEKAYILNAYQTAKILQFRKPNKKNNSGPNL